MISFKKLFVFLSSLAFFTSLYAASTGTVTEPHALSVATAAPSGIEVSSASATTALPMSADRPVHALHVTAWMAGSKKYRAHVNELFKTTVVNTVVIDVKEYEGEVYVPGVKLADTYGSYVPAMPDIANWLADLKKQGIYTVARIVVFKDNIMPRKQKALAVKTKTGELWFDHHKITWLDPYNPEAWRYNLLIGLQAAKLGFDEIQFDYIRFPTDGALSQMHFSKPYEKNAASRALIEFLKQANQLLHPMGTKISIDVFGLTTTVKTGMGIGQLIGPMTEQVDFVCPMIYPSHYASGEYGIRVPNNEPYKIISIALRDAIKNLGPEARTKLRPYLQDFSLRNPKILTADEISKGIKIDPWIRYGKKEVRAQMQAAADLGVNSWTLWNARCSYTLGALQTPVIPVSSAITSTFTATSSSDVKTTSK